MLLRNMQSENLRYELCKIEDIKIATIDDTISTWIFYHFPACFYNLLLMPSCMAGKSSSLPSISSEQRKRMRNQQRERERCTNSDITVRKCRKLWQLWKKVGKEEASSCATAREMKSGRRTIVYKFDRWNSPSFFTRYHSCGILLATTNATLQSN